MLMLIMMKSESWDAFGDDCCLGTFQNVLRVVLSVKPVHLMLLVCDMDRTHYIVAFWSK